MAYNEKNRLDAIALTHQAIDHRNLSVEHRIQLLTRAIFLDPTLDLPRVALFRIAHKSALMQNLEKPNTAVTLQRFLPKPTAPLPPNSEQIPQALKTFLATVDALPASDGAATAPQWSKINRAARYLALNFTDPRYIVQIAQNLNLTGFDHRAHDETYVNLIKAKATLLGKAFGIDPFDIPELRDSPHSLAHSLMNVMGRPVSSSTFWHASFLMRILTHIDIPHLRILEIGGGYGGLAMLFKESGRCKQYIIVDLAESLIFSYAFLKLAFPESDLRLCATEDDVAQIGDADFALVPAQLSEQLAGEKFDVALNTGSFQEMTTKVVRYYMKIIQHKCDCKYLYSMNYFLENRDGNPETLSLRKDERNLTSLELDAHWEVNYFEINPPHIVVDSRRNWCEVLLRRAHLDPSAPRSADELLSAIDSLEFGSQVWFQQVWIALWRFPTRRLVDRFLAGIKGFSGGSVPVREARKRFGAPAPSFDSLGEVQYWRARRDNLPE